MIVRISQEQRRNIERMALLAALLAASLIQEMAMAALERHKRDR